MGTPAMVRKIPILILGIITSLLIVAVLLVTRRCCNCDECRESQSVTVAETALKPREKPLTDEEAEECFRAFEGICNAYSNLQFETMQELFCGISNKVARLGKDRIDRTIETLQTSFRERFRGADLKTIDFSEVAEFDRFIRANIAAANIIGYSMTANGVYYSNLREYDMVVFNRIKVLLEKFEEKKGNEFKTAAQSLLDEWKEHLASGQSITRMQLRLELKWCLRLPRWQAEDMGMKSERDWIAYMRNHALKFHEHCYGVVPKWIDEDFPLPQDGDDGTTGSGKDQK